MKKKLQLIAYLFLISISAYSQVNLSLGIVAYYPFDNSPNDTTSNALDLTVNGSPLGAIDRFGAANSAYELNASNPDYFTTFTNPLQAPAELSLSAWVNLTNAFTDQKIAGRAGVGAGGYLMGVDSNKLDAEIWDLNGTHFRLKGGLVPNNTWTHLVISFKANDYLKIYINGSIIDSTPSGTMGAGTDPIWSFTVGGAPWQPAALNASGKLDDIYLYNRAINSAEVQALYSITTGINFMDEKNVQSSIYPVPASTDFLNIKFGNSGSGKIYLNIFDAQGRIVYQNDYMNKTEDKIDLRNLKDEIYFLRISYDNRNENISFIKSK